MSIRTGALKLLDTYRGLLHSAFDLRRYDVAIVLRRWPLGALPGAHGVSPTETVTPITVGSSNRPKVVQLTQAEIVASGGLYQDQDVKIGPLTPQYNGGGSAISSFEPPATGGIAEVFIKLVGPGTADGGDLYKKIGQSTEQNFGFSIVARRVGAYAP